MTQAQLERQVAAATGESMHTIRCRGFSEIPTYLAVEPSPPAAPRTVDWDEVQAARVAYFPERRRPLLVAS